MCDEGGPVGSREVHRVREASVQAAIHASALRRIKLAETSKTPLTLESLELKQGDDVEIFRKQGVKDRPGWVGPAKVISTGRTSEGTVTVDYKVE